MDKADHFATSSAAGVLRPLLGWLQALSAVTILGLAICPTRWIESGPNLCLFRQFFGIECYGCGMTRALSWLLHGHLSIALNYNRGAVVVLPLLCALALSAVCRPLFTRAA